MQTSKSELPLVSIITASYQRFERLYDTINSVVNQDYPNIEYIITDDGSDFFPFEDVRAFLRKRANSNVQWFIVQHELNIGTVKNLNSAYKKSKGNYVINLSCGDVFFDNNIVSRIVNRFITTKRDVIVTSRMVYRGSYTPLYLLPHYAERKVIQRFDSSIKQYSAFITSAFYDMASGSAMCFSRSILERIGYFDERYLLWEDGPFLAKYLMIGKLEFAYDIISIWYENGGVSSARKFKNKHPKLQEDELLFARDEKLEHLDSLSLVNRRRLYRINKRLFARSKKQKVAIDIVYFPETLFYIYYVIKRKYYKKRDVSIIKKIICDNNLGK
ncbi:MAG: glycosyltransferase [Salinivirgaceae bacterium]|nr:glycosyltransferase [Salinivirgaceae bacterium]